MAPISKKLRFQVLYENGCKKPTNLSRKVGISLATAYRWKDKLENDENLDRKEYPVRMSKINKKIQKRVISKIQLRKQPSLRQIGRSVGLSHESVRSLLRNQTFSYKLKKKRFKLNAERRALRLEFARKMLGRDIDWGLMVITDEASMWLERAVPNGRWVHDGAMEIEDEGDNGRGNNENDDIDDLTVGRHGQKIHLWGGISANGTTKLHLFSENLKEKKNVNLLKKGREEMARLYPDGFIFQQDGHPCHKSKLAQKFIMHNFDATIDWPGYSPDISPIENIWSWLKSEVSKDRPTTLEAMKRSLRKHWKRLTPEFLAPYFNSMPDRMRMIIESEGNRINY